MHHTSLLWVRLTKVNSNNLNVHFFITIQADFKATSIQVLSESGVEYFKVELNLMEGSETYDVVSRNNTEKTKTYHVEMEISTRGNQIVEVEHKYSHHHSIAGFVQQAYQHSQSHRVIDPR